LSLKNLALLSYIHHLVHIASLRLKGTSLQSSSDDASGGGPSALVHELVRLRVVLEKIRPLEKKLRYQVEKLVRKANDSGDRHVEEEDVANGMFQLGLFCTAEGKNRVVF
jgi:U3 small nucleolar ribonucleoprotein protein LCP5